MPTGPAANWATSPDIDVTRLADGAAVFTITASYSFGGTATVTRTVTIDNP